VRGPVEIVLFTDHVQAATSFYERLVGVTTEAEWPGGAIFATGGVQLLVHERPGAIEGGPPNEDHVAFGVPNSPRGLMWVRRACREGMHQAAWSARAACRLESLDAGRDGRAAPCAGPQPCVRLTRIKPQDACEELRERGFAFLVEPRDYPWGRPAYLRDPDGRLVELSEMR